MKKILYMAVAAIAALSSCSNEDVAGNNNSNGGEGEVFTGTIGSLESFEGGVNAKSTLVSNTPNWESTDKVTVNGVEFNTTPDASDATKAVFTTASTTKVVSPYKAAFQLTETVSEDAITFSLPASYTYVADKFNMPMYAESANKTLSFNNVCGLLAIKVTSTEMSKVTGVSVTSDKAISGTCTIAADAAGKYYATATGTEDADKTVTLNCTADVTPTSDGTIFYLPLPALSDATLYVTVMGEANASKASSYAPFIYTQSMKKKGVTIAANTIYPVTFATSIAKFSTGEDKKVFFTNGNLWSDNSDNLRLETSQIAYQTSWDASHVSHFYWTVDKKDSYCETYPTGITPATTDTPWFASNVTVGSTYGLRVLTGDSKGEYKYLLNTRGEGKLYKKGVTVGSLENCLIIAPDNFVGTLKESYTDEAELKAYGLVCLPAAGYRNGNSFSNTGSAGNYWSATQSSYGTSSVCYMYFNKSYLDPASDSYHNRNYGCSLRLVKTDEFIANPDNEQYTPQGELTGWNK